MFLLSDTSLDAEALKRDLERADCGACVTFEGWVRNHNEGRSVHRMEYEAYAAVALSEGQRILDEAISRFGLGRAVCVHRVGSLGLGDLAVWVGVSTPHRGEAFDACRHIIDEVKHRVPIWKKEHYTEGDSGWVNCERCASHGHVAPVAASAERDYYERQIRLPEVGEAGQRKLKESRVLVVGAGGLGCSALPYLAAAGVGHIGVCDGDTLDISNLHRQILFSHEEVGRPKAELAVARLRALNPYVHFETYPFRADPKNVERLLDRYEYVLDCTDNFETKFLLNDASVIKKKVLIHAGIYQYEGQVFVYVPDSDAPCLRCLWPETPAPDCVGSCAEVGVLGAVPGFFGVMQAVEAIKQILGLPGVVCGSVLFFDLMHYQTQRVRAVANPKCPVCSGGATISAAEIDSVELDLAEVQGDASQTLQWVDIRDSDEAALSPLGVEDALLLPAAMLGEDGSPLKRDQGYLLCCGRGVRSRYLAMRLRGQGYARVYSLRDGVRVLRAHRAAKP